MKKKAQVVTMGKRTLIVAGGGGQPGGDKGAVGMGGGYGKPKKFKKPVKKVAKRKNLIENPSFEKSKPSKKVKAWSDKVAQKIAAQIEMHENIKVRGKTPIPDETEKYRVWRSLYCSECGERLVFDKRKLTGFDTTTGKPNFRDDYKCPKLFGFMGWWRGLGGVYHTSESIRIKEKNGS